MFEAFPEDIPEARIMDKLKDELGKPSHQKVYVTEENMSVFGESTYAGKITENCLQSLRERNIAIPETFLKGSYPTVIIGEM